MSFFDEDDEPPRTARTRVRPSPPRRGRVTSGGPTDAQTVLVRRMIAGIVGLLILLLLFFGVRACNNSRHKNALRDYTSRVTAIGTESQGQGDQLFKAMDGAAQTSPTELYQNVLSIKGSADQSLKQAQALSVPGDMTRRAAVAADRARAAPQRPAEGLRRRQERARRRGRQRRPGDHRDRRADARVRRLRRPLQRPRPAVHDRRAEEGRASAATSPRPQFLREISWVSPAYVASKLGKRLSTTDSGGDNTTDKNQTTGPGLHGTGLNATSYGTVALTPTASNRLTYVKGQPFTVAFTNQGDNDEFNVKVTLKIQLASGTGSAITLNKTVPQVAKGEKATVELPLNREPPLGAVVNINVTVAKVPGEEKTDNNKSTYPTLFVQG